MEDSKRVIRVVFICTGNVCRSPMAEGIMRQLWNKTNSTKDLHVSSMGIHGMDSSPPSENSRVVCEENGIDISSHRSRGIVMSELEDSDFIFCMEEVHKEYLRVFLPKISEKAFLITEWPNNKKQKNIADPMGMSLRHYRKTFRKIEKFVKNIVEILAKEDYL